MEVAWLGLFVAVVALLVTTLSVVRQHSVDIGLGKQIDRVAGGIDGARQDEANRAQAETAARAAATQSQRRANLRARLRSEYIASHDGISPSLMAGNADPPEAWCRSTLRAWGIDEREVYPPG